MPAQTERGALPYPLGTDPPDTDGAIRGLADALAVLAAFDRQGTLAARPAAGTRGLYYWATDTGQTGGLYRDTGTAWHKVTTAPASPLTLTAFTPAETPLTLKLAALHERNALEVRSSTNAVVAAVGQTGAVVAQGAAPLLNASGVYGAGLSVQAEHRVQTPLVVRGIATQAEHLTEWQSDTGAVVARIGATGGYLGPRVHALNNDPANVTLLARAAAAQTAAVVAVEDSAATLVARIDTNGHVRAATGGNTSATGLDLVLEAVFS